LEPAVTMGPLHTHRAQLRAQGLLEDATRRGANARTLGRIDNEAIFSGGYFMRPTVVTDVPDDAPLMTEEQFCPAIPVATYDDIDDAIARANQSVYGLSGSIWSRDIDRAMDLARRVAAGQVWINSHGPQPSITWRPMAVSSRAASAANRESTAFWNTSRARPSPRMNDGRLRRC
jgi:acyl-CoA reductase-like NAD-dependent aldehyde dehydrogenase